MANRLGMLVRKISGSAPVKIYYFIGWSAHEKNIWTTEGCTQLAANRKGQKQEHHWKTCWRENFTQVMVEEKIMGSSLGRLHGTMAEGAPEPRTRIGNESPAPLKTFNIIKPKEEHPYKREQNLSHLQQRQKIESWDASLKVRGVHSMGHSINSYLRLSRHP